jgi:S1-C subfamily serine protease
LLYLRKCKSDTRGAREVAVFRKAAPAVVLIKTKEGLGSGIILKSGLILTNRHVVEGFGSVQIFFKPGENSNSAETRPGIVKFVDIKRDLAIITPDSLPANSKILDISPSDEFDV